MPTLIAEHMLNTFVSVSNMLDVAAARQQLDSLNKGVLLHDGDAAIPLALVSIEDLKDLDGALPLKAIQHLLLPAVIVGQNVPMQRLASIAARVQTGGAIVIGDVDTVVGVLPTRLIDAFRYSPEYQLDAPMLGGSDLGAGDAVLAGSLRPPRTRVLCKICQYPNDFSRTIDFQNLPLCQNLTAPQHQLSLR